MPGRVPRDHPSITPSPAGAASVGTKTLRVAQARRDSDLGRAPAFLEGADQRTSAQVAWRETAEAGANAACANDRADRVDAELPRGPTPPTAEQRNQKRTWALAPTFDRCVQQVRVARAERDHALTATTNVERASRRAPILDGETDDLAGLEMRQEMRDTTPSRSSSMSPPEHDARSLSVSAEDRTRPTRSGGSRVRAASTRSRSLAASMSPRS